jgi:hypothetical protein
MNLNTIFTVGILLVAVLGVGYLIYASNRSSDADSDNGNQQSK